MSTYSIPSVAPGGRLRVSVIVVNYGTPGWLQRCLDALIAHTPPVYELVLIENGSPDDSRRFIERHVSGARVIVNERNVGFGPACNQGAAAARGPALCFLNPDAIVQPGWLEPLLAQLDADRSVGVVVPMLRNWDERAWQDDFAGSLQEAGCIVGRDGSTQSLGFGDDPAWSWYRFPRVVDYGSFACAVVRRSAFEAVGGFDPAYAPAYCEDVDLCFALDERGWRTVYEPRSTVLHLRGAAVDDATRSALLQRNTEQLRERWKSRVGRRPSITEFPAYAHRSVAARDAVCSARVLVVGPAAASADRWAGLSDVRVTVVADSPLPDAGSLLAAGVEVVAGPGYDWVDFFERRWFQYDAVVGEDGDTELIRHVARTQPQAIRVGDTGEAATGAALAGVGVVV